MRKPPYYFLNFCKIHHLLVVGLLLQFRKLLLGKDSVTLPKEFLSKFGVSRGTKQRALKKLEEAGLVNVTQELGRTPVIAVLKA